MARIRLRHKCRLIDRGTRMAFFWMLIFMHRRTFIALICILCAVPALAVPAASSPVVLVLGDSISAGYGLPQDAGWTTLLQRRLDSERYAFTVVNASISGDTTAG